MTQVITSTDFIDSLWNRASNNRGHEAEWLRSLREDAWAQFQQEGIPNTRQENWRATNILPVFRTEYAESPAALSPEAIRKAISDAGLDHTNALVSVNGRYSTECSSDGLKGFEIRSGAELLQTPFLAGKLAQSALGIGFPFTALNTALLEDVLWVKVLSDADPRETLSIIHVTTVSDLGSFSHPRTLIHADSDSDATIAEYYLTAREGDGVECTNAVTEVSVGQGARLKHLRCVLSDGFHFGRLAVDQAESSDYNNVSVTLNGRIVRNDLSCGLYGENAHGELNGLVMSRGSQLVDNHTWIEHALPNCTSHELYKAILDDESHVVFNGRIHVHPGAQKTDAVQANRNLLLSEDALVNTNPQLEIYADDVKCTHGATIGQLDEDARFYLQARGLKREQALALLVSAFAKETLDHLDHADLSQWCSTKVDEWLARPGTHTVKG
jgi:Fe-S cluster assembly protein SufD